MGKLWGKFYRVSDSSLPQQGGGPVTHSGVLLINIPFIGFLLSYHLFPSSACWHHSNKTCSAKTGVGTELWRQWFFLTCIYMYSGCWFPFSAMFSIGIVIWELTYMAFHIILLLTKGPVFFFDKGGKWSWNSLVLPPTHISLNLKVAGLMELWDSLLKGQWSIALLNRGTIFKMSNNFQPIATIFRCVCDRICGSRNRCKVWRGPFHYSRWPSWGNFASRALCWIRGPDFWGRDWAFLPGDIMVSLNSCCQVFWGSLCY